MSSPGCCFRLATASVTSPLSSIEFHASGSSNVVDATNFGRLYILSVKGSPDLERRLLLGRVTREEFVASWPSREELVGLPLRDLVVPVGHRPTAVLELTGGAGVLGHSVQ